MDVEALRAKRDRAVMYSDWNVVREIDSYAQHAGIQLFTDEAIAKAKQALGSLETAEPPALEHAIPPVRRGPGRPRSD